MPTAEPGSKGRVSIVAADNPARLEAVRTLFKEYAASLSFNLCFQSFEEELALLPGEYAPPCGTLLLGLVAGQTAGCVALHRIDNRRAVTRADRSACGHVCEMKRLFVRPAIRGSGVGRELVNGVLNSAVAIGYGRMRLDTVPSEMGTAVQLYRKLGFIEIPAYRVNPVPGAAYMELDLRNWQASSAGGSART
ncbi:MAG: GNAT family N-acetyltransferase [Terriglobales bacterium]|jgi:GNAT superfamily N-acetyltransferase